MFATVFNRIFEFFRQAFESVKEGLLFIGGPYDIVIALLDVALLSFIFYFILKIVRDSRAWQLLKGLILVALIALIANLSGLSTVGFVLNNTISVFAIAVVVIFQPELRRALETVGRSGLTLFNISTGEWNTPGREQQMIESIVTACDEMAQKRTGALIIIERTTPLGDLAEQENAIAVDAAISATMLKQIFYVGSPLHDGAVVIRNGKIAVARVHIPLSDNYHLRKDLGTRHRAAIGASEIGDSIAVVVSEERGTISLAVEGRLYVLDNSDALRSNLHRLLLPDNREDENHKHFLPLPFKTEPLRRKLKQPKKGLVLASVFLSLAMWFYVQSKLNPIQINHYQVPLVYLNGETTEAKGLRVQLPLENVQISLKARKNFFDSLSQRDVRAYVDLSKIDRADIQSLPIQVETGSNAYYRVENLLPQEITISVRPAQTPTEP